MFCRTGLKVTVMSVVTMRGTNPNEWRRVRRLISPYISSIITIGKIATQGVFDQVWSEIELEDESDEEWLNRFIAKTIIDEQISKEEQAKIPVAVSAEQMKLVQVMAIALAQSLRMRGLVEEGYKSEMMRQFVFREIMTLALNEEDVGSAVMYWNLLADLASKFGSAEYRLSRTFDLVSNEVSTSKDPAFAAHLLIQKLGDRRMEKALLRMIASEDDEVDGWFVA